MKKNIISKIMKHEVFRTHPPVLVDVGASGEIHKEWAQIAPYSICIAFDGDDRELKSVKSSSSGYRELILYHRVLTVSKEDHTDFYLTASPYCSSTLMPDYQGLSAYNFRPFFDVEKKIQLKSITLNEVLEENNLNYIDWFKTDSQGTDLRLFAALDSKIIDNIKIAEFEPGIIDAYCGEDKFYDLLKWMNGKKFFLNSLNVEPVYRLKTETVEKFKFSPKVWRYAKPTPGWVNLSFLNTGSDCNSWNLRDCLFFMVCCIINRQYGMVLELSELMQQNFPDEKIFAGIKKYAQKKLTPGPFKTCINVFLRKLSAFLYEKVW